MKFATKLLAILFLSSLSLLGQSFSVVSHDIVKAGELNGEIIFEYEITNLTSADLTLSIVRRAEDLTADWTSSFCFDNCFAPFIDSIATDEGFQSSPLSAGETRTFSVHIFPMMNSGIGSLAFDISDKNNLSDKEEFTVYATTEMTEGNSYFEVQQHDTAKIGEPGDELVYEFEIKNITNVPLVIDIKRTLNNMATDWSSSFCFDNCFAPFIDTISTTADWQSTPLMPNETREFSVHVFTSNIPETGSVEVAMFNHAMRSETYEFEMTAETQAVGIEDDAVTPNEFELAQNYPNPFNPSTNINFNMPEAGYAKLTVYDILGNKVSTLLDGEITAGVHSFHFNAANLASGIYFYQLNTGNFSATKKMILEK